MSRTLKHPGRIRAIGLAVALLGLALQAPLSIGARAATPAGGTITAPAVPGTVRFDWQGVVAPGASNANGPGLRCQGVANDQFNLKLHGVDAAFYTTHTATLTIQIDWTPVISAEVNSLQLTTAYDNGSGTLTSFGDGSSNGAGTSSSWSYSNPAATVDPGFIRAMACAAYNVSSQPYTGHAILQVQNLTLDANSVTLTHPVDHAFAAVVGSTGGQLAGPTQGLPSDCPATACDSFNLRVIYPAAPKQYLRSHRVTLNIHYTWPDTTQDLDVLANDPGNAGYGPGAPDSTNPNSGFEDLALVNPLDGVWLIRSVAGVVTVPTAATAHITLTSVPIPVVVLPPEPPPAPGSPSFTNYQSPDVAPWKAAGSNEPGLGIDSKTGEVLYKDNQFTARVHFDDTKKPATATWTDVTPPTQSVLGTTLDPILFTDQITNRTFVSDLLGACSFSSYSDDDGASWTQDQGCGTPAGPDHQTIGGGPFPASVPLGAVGYPNAVYYCSQAIAAALCAMSANGGLTFGPGVPIYNTSQCTGLHGHVKVAPDGTVYVPNKDCGNGTKAAIVSEDAGTTWSVRPIPGSATPDAASQVTFQGGPLGTQGGQSQAFDFSVGHDPAIGVAKDDGTLYEGYVDMHGESTSDNPNATSPAMIAVSHDKGLTWSAPIDVGAQLGVKNSDFAEVVGGDHGRAAFAFIGSRTSGNSYQPNFSGDWYLYVSFTKDFGKTWTTVDATPGDPVQRGCVWNVGDPTGTLTQCRNMLDFNDIQLDPQGRVLAAYTDGCAGACDRDPQQQAYSSVAALVRQTAGTSIISACGTTFSAGCAVPALTSRGVRGPSPNTSAPSPQLLALLLVAVAAIALAAVAARRRWRRRVVR